MKNHLYVLAAGFLTTIVNAEPIRKDLMSGTITPCQKLELNQGYNATYRSAPQTATVFAIVDVPNAANIKVAAEQCLVAAGAAAGAAALLASPPGAFPTFKASFDLCAKAKSAELLAAKVSLDVESKCAWGADAAPVQKNPLTEHPVFDLGFYIAVQDDVRNQTGGDLIKSEAHWINFGLNEGRRGSRLFDPRFYLENHGDLVAAFGASNYGEAAKHWITYGLKEGRASSFEFDANYYLANNKDLRDAFGSDNYTAAAQHWIQFGIKEGRQGSSKFSVRKYLSRYADLQTEFGSTNYAAAYDHWLHFGKKEGRSSN